MIQIELPCCGAIADLEPDAETVRCDDCACLHLLAADARLAPSEGATVGGPSVPVAARVAVLAA